MPLKLSKFFSILLVCSMITFTMVLFVLPSGYLPNWQWNLKNLTHRSSKFKANVRKSYCEVLKEHYGLPEDLKIQGKLYVIVAFRDREEHKATFMDEMTKYLRQKVRMLFISLYHIFMQIQFSSNSIHF